MLGGIDIVLPASGRSLEETNIFLHYVKKLWPDAILETSDEVREISDVNAYNLSSDQLLIYESKTAKRSWDRYGATDKNLNKAIVVYLEKECFVVNVGDEKSIFFHCEFQIMAMLRQRRSIKHRSHPMENVA
jgi:hypothetical protein